MASGGTYLNTGVQYIFIDGVNFDMRIGNTIEKVPVLAAIGVTESGARLVLGLQSGDKESASSWRQFFKDLKKRRGLQSHLVKLGIMDGLTRLRAGLQGRILPKRKFNGAKYMSHAMCWPRCLRSISKQVADGDAVDLLCL